MQCVKNLFASFAIREYQYQRNIVCAVIMKIYTIKFGVFEAKLREDKSKYRKIDLQKQQNIFIVATDSKEAAVNASTLRQK
jgi:hypothetical protein